MNSKFQFHTENPQGQNSRKVNPLNDACHLGIGIYSPITCEAGIQRVKPQIEANLTENLSRFFLPSNHREQFEKMENYL